VRTLCFAMWRQLLGRWGWLWWGLALVVLLRLHFDPTLGRAHLGGYLASVALGPSILLLRLGVVLQQRRRQGWPLEECLRNPMAWRAPFAEVLSTGGLMLAWFLLAGLGPHLPGLAQPRAGQELFPITVPQANDDGSWTLDLEGRCPPNAKVLLTIDWLQANETLRSAGTTSYGAADGRQITLVAGELASWPLLPEEAGQGQAVLPPLPEGLELLRPLTRLSVDSPGLSELPRLLWGQALFFLPLLGLFLAWARAGRISGPLAAWATLALAGLVALPGSSQDLPADALGFVARALLGLKAALPAVDSLLATGDDFARHLRATSLSSTLMWWLLGILGFAGACLRRPPFRP
jgi:hypothetical protein